METNKLILDVYTHPVSRNPHHSSSPRVILLYLILILGLVTTNASAKEGKSGFEKKGNLGGPASVGGLLEEDDAVKEPALRMPFFDDLLGPWFDYKGKLSEEHGLQVGAAYTYLYQSASDAPAGAEDDAGMGIIRLFGRWELLGRGTNNTGTLVFSGTSPRTPF